MTKQIKIIESPRTAALEDEVNFFLTHLPRETVDDVDVQVQWVPDDEIYIATILYREP